MGSTLSQQELDEAIESIDTDGDGEISFDELLVWFQSGSATNLAKMIRKQCAGKQTTFRAATICALHLLTPMHRYSTKKVKLPGKKSKPIET